MIKTNRILNPLRILARRTIFISKNTKAEKDGKSDMNKKVISTAGDKRLSSDVILRPPPSMRNNPLIRIDPPPNTPTNAPPKWMLKYFPHYFEREKLSDLGPEEHNQPYGATGVYGIIATGLLTFGLIAAHLYERLFTDSLESARYAVHEQRVREELKKLLKEAE